MTVAKRRRALPVPGSVDALMRRERPRPRGVRHVEAQQARLPVQPAPWRAVALVRELSVGDRRLNRWVVAHELGAPAANVRSRLAPQRVLRLVRGAEVEAHPRVEGREVEMRRALTVTQLSEGLRLLYVAPTRGQLGCVHAKLGGECLGRRRRCTASRWHAQKLREQLVKVFGLAQHVHQTPHLAYVAIGERHLDGREVGPDIPRVANAAAGRPADAVTPPAQRHRPHPCRLFFAIREGIKERLFARVAQDCSATDEEGLHAARKGTRRPIYGWRAAQRMADGMLEGRAIVG